MNKRKLLRVTCVFAVLVAAQGFLMGAHASAGTPNLHPAASEKMVAGHDALGSPGAGTVLRASPVGTISAFDVPGAGTGILQGTFPSAMNLAGTITGSFVDANYVYHGFVRAAGRAITTFDVPAAGSQGTFPTGINSQGTITGSFVDANSVYHGFLRTSRGTVTTFDVSGAYFFQTSSINSSGAVAGTYFDTNFVPHAFLRTHTGTVSAFDAPGAVNGTQGVGLSPQGDVIGTFTDAASVSHGFLRASDGAFTTFDVPAGPIVAFAPFSLVPSLVIDPAGAITGAYFQPIQGNPFGGNYRVFVRAPNSTYTTFDAATYPPCCIWSFPSGMTPSGVIVGAFNDGFTVNHGFLRAADGRITMIDVPGAGSGLNEGTEPLGITPSGTVMGIYKDANDATHGFVLTLAASALNGSP